jgi:hypothetical protein
VCHGVCVCVCVCVCARTRMCVCVGGGGGTSHGPPVSESRGPPQRLPIMIPGARDSDDTGGRHCTRRQRPRLGPACRHQAAAGRRPTGTGLPPSSSAGRRLTRTGLPHEEEAAPRARCRRRGASPRPHRLLAQLAPARSTFGAAGFQRCRIPAEKAAVTMVHAELGSIKEKIELVSKALTLHE